MGQRQLKSPSRAWIATVFLVLATVVPLVAWYIVGNDGAEREADRARRLTALRAQRVAIALAQRLSGRLESIRAAESRRPSYHYQSAFHDPLSDCACASMTPSPLSVEPTDPLIRAYFQLDPMGEIHLPRLVRDPGNGAAPEEEAWVQREEALRSQLAEAKVSLLESLRSGGGTAMPGLRRRLPVTHEETAHLLVDGVKAVGPMSWVSFPAVSGDETLLARRVVWTEAGQFVQGFLIDDDAMQGSLEGAYYPARCQPVEPTRPGTAMGADLELPGVGWRVTVDATNAVAEAEDEARRILRHFRIVFSVVAAAASLAGACVIGLVWQTDRLARQRSRFAAAAAHELRTPLAGLRLSADMLASGLGDPSKTREYAAYLASEAERLGRVVSNVLGYSRLEHGAFTVRAQPGDLGEVAEESARRLEPTLRAGGASLEFAIETDLPPVRFDRDGVTHILQNLLDNAEKYTRESADRTILVALRSVPGHVELSVSDRGPGVSDAFRSRLFEPFSRREDPNSPAGLGLGLSIVDNLARAHGGTAGYRNREGGGSTFFVVFPSVS
jgi:signal transduction histidine kinase